MTHKYQKEINEIQSWTDTLLAMGPKCTNETARAQVKAIQALEKLGELEAYLEDVQSVKNSYVADIINILN